MRTVAEWDEQLTLRISSYSVAPGYLRKSLSSDADAISALDGAFYWAQMPADGPHDWYEIFQGRAPLTQDHRNLMMALLLKYERES